MIILDTDHITVLSFPKHAQYAELRQRVSASNGIVLATTVVTLEEEMRGWLAVINRYSDVHKQLGAYERLIDLFTFFTRWQIVPFQSGAANEFKRLRKQGVRIGTMDLKIASIALVNDATVLSANLRDFRQVPGLRVENWLES